VRHPRVRNAGVGGGGWVDEKSECAVELQCQVL
jgi:hypothetical protein